MSTPGLQNCCPLLRFSEDELKHSLAGFPEPAISGALALQKTFDQENLEACLFGIFLFYIPLGAEVPEEQPSGPVKLRGDLGLDSLSLAEAMYKIEELFDIRVENSEIADVATLSDAGILLFKKVTEKASTQSDE